MWSSYRRIGPYRMIGRISEGLNKGDFDWVMSSDNILTFDYVKSPAFFFASIPWHVQMEPKNDYMSLFLHKNDLEAEKCLTMSFKMIFLGKELQKVIDEGPAIFYKESEILRGWSDFITRKCLLDCWTNASKVCGEVIVRIKLRDYLNEGLFKIRGKEILSQNYKDLLLSGNDHDLVIKVKDKDFKAHRIIMQARCPVFKSMLEHEMLEKKSGVVDIPDCDPSAFEQFLLYIYTGDLVEVLDNSTMLDLYFIADKYDMEYLREECCTFIKESLSVHVVCNVIKIALDHSDSELLEFATEYFVSNAKEILNTVEWMSFIKAYPIEANEFMIKALDVNHKCSYCYICRSEVGALEIFLYLLFLIVCLYLFYSRFSRKCDIQE